MPPKSCFLCCSPIWIVFFQRDPDWIYMACHEFICQTLITEYYNLWNLSRKTYYHVMWKMEYQHTFICLMYSISMSNLYWNWAKYYLNYQRNRKMIMSGMKIDFMLLYYCPVQKWRNYWPDLWINSDRILLKFHFKSYFRQFSCRRTKFVKISNQ